MRNADATPRKSAVLLWTAAILTFLVLSVAASLRADAATATKVARWNASGDVRSVSIENINGDVKISAGSAVTATVELKARGRSDERAKAALERTKTLFANENGDVVMTVEPPETTRRRGRFFRWSDDHDDWNVEARWTVTVPPNVPIDVSTVNGSVVSDGIAADLELSSVNGKITFTGAKGNVRVKTVNGAVDGTVVELRQGADVEAETVNGNVVFRLPKNAGFRFSGKTMSGEIRSSFPLPAARSAEAEDLEHAEELARKAREKTRVERKVIREKQKRARDDEDVTTIEIDMEELNREMANLDREMAELSRSISRTVVLNLNRSYEGTVGNGGARVKVSNLNGRILLLAEGTAEADARSLVGAHGAHVTAFSVPPEVPEAPIAPRVHVTVPRPPKAPRAFVVRTGQEEDASVVQGDVQGDFTTNIPMGDVKVGKVSGRVKVSTKAGQVSIERAGAGADVKSWGGDVSIGAVSGDLVAYTFGGNVLAGPVSGDAKLETQGGDVTLRAGGGSVFARTGGGDIELSKVKGSVKAETEGGSIVCELVTADPRPGCELSTSGGDVTLTLPGNVKADVEVLVADVDSDIEAIRSDFPEIRVMRGARRATASGKLNGGGARVTVRSSSGTVTLRKGPAAS